MSIRRAQDERIEGTPDGNTAIVEISDVPDAPTIGTATDSGDGTTASITFTAAATGGTVTTYTATSTPSSITGTSASSPVSVTGLTAGTAYTFKVKGANSTGTSVESSASNSVTLVTPTAFTSIETITLASPSSAITFSSIPQTYKHLQIRGIAKGTTSGDQDLYMQVGTGSITTVNYTWHNAYGTGATTYGGQSGSGANYIVAGWNFAIATASTDVVAGTIIDISDYARTDKNKTVRSISGSDKNGGGTVGLYSGFCYDFTTAIDTIKLYPASGSFNTYTTFALYGIAG